MLTVSAIIPALNEESRIARGVERAFRAGADEVIVVDGGSDDGTLAVAEGTPCIALPSRRGRAVQQNEGAKRATGDILLFLHADCYLPPHAIQQIRERLVDATLDGGAFLQKIEAPGFLYRCLERGNAWRARFLHLPYGDQGIFLRREVFLKLGSFPEVPFMEDLLLMRHFRRKHRGVLLAGPLYVDARRWKRRGVIRQTARNWALLTAQRCGISLEKLARFYPSDACPRGAVEPAETLDESLIRAEEATN